MVWVKVIRDRRAFLIRFAFPVIPDGAHARGVRSGDWLQRDLEVPRGRLVEAAGLVAQEEDVLGCCLFCVSLPVPNQRTRTLLASTNSCARCSERPFTGCRTTTLPRRSLNTETTLSGHPSRKKNPPYDSPPSASMYLQSGRGERPTLDRESLLRMTHEMMRDQCPFR